jgi:crotonobetainyl-CoA:carnitine CoA-transferase CaiB-like acyl-CoA transferase
MTGPLHGIRIVDLTTVVMGPSATQILGDLGADVIKIESGTGDSMRHVGPMRSPGMGPLFLQANRNKRSVSLDLKDVNDRAALDRLIENADVFVSNIRPQAMGRLGLDYAGVSAINPSIVYCAMVGYGEGGPYAGAAVYDDLMQAASGLAGMFERVDGKPRYAPINICDRVVGLYATIAIQAALFHRAATGEGQEVEVPMFETMAQFVLADHMGGRAFVPPLGDAGYLRLLSRTRGPYVTQDGAISVVVYTDSHWRKFGAMIGRPTMIDDDERLRSLATRTIHAEFAGDLLAGELARRTTEQWLAAFKEADIPACRVNSVDDLFDDPHLRAVDFFSEVEHPTEGTLLVARPSMQFSKTPLEVRRLAPRLDQDAGAAFDAVSSSGRDHPAA